MLGCISAAKCDAKISTEITRGVAEDVPDGHDADRLAGRRRRATSSARPGRRPWRRFGTFGYEVINDTVADSFAWDLGADATPATADVAEPTWRYATPGTKRVSLTATSASGCAVTKTFSAAARVLGCDVAIPASAVVYTADGDLASGTDHWICAGASVAGGDGLGRVFIEPGARFDYSGGGAYVAIVRAGGTLGGDDRIAVVYEAGADVADLSDEAYACETLDVDLSDAPSPGCP